jgi:molecular chaperone Hsp33
VNEDVLIKFMLGSGQVRGVVVRLDDSWQSMRERRLHDDAVQLLLGEMAAASALLAGSLKFDGTLVLQLQGDGPVRLAVAECQPDFGLRATAQVQGDARGDFAALVNARGGARCQITLDPRRAGQQPYRGVVALVDADGAPMPDLAAVLGHYLQHSEQIPSWLLLAADAERACGLLVQRMPGDGGHAGAEDNDEAFARAVHLASTLGRDELLQRSPEDLLHKLFWQEQPRVFEPLHPRFHCTCSAQRVSGMLRMLGRDEVESVLAERGEVEVTCEFCGAVYTLDAVDAAQLFHAAVDQPPTPGEPQ